MIRLEPVDYDERDLRDDGDPGRFGPLLALLRDEMDVRMMPADRASGFPEPYWSPTGAPAELSEGVWAAEDRTWRVLVAVPQPWSGLVWYAVGFRGDAGGEDWLWWDAYSDVLGGARQPSLAALGLHAMAWVQRAREEMLEREEGGGGRC